jgi:hypothetical protein
VTRTRSSLFLLLAFLIVVPSWAEEETPSAPTGPSRPAAKIPEAGNFYLGVFDPYPGTFGLNIVHYVGHYLGIYAGVGTGTILAYGVGVRFRPVIKKLSPLIGFTWSSGQDIGKTRKGFLTLETAVEWKWDSGLFAGAGIHWGITHRQGKSELKPFGQFGLAY